MKTTEHIMGAYDSELKEMISEVSIMGEKVLGMMEFSRKALTNPSDELVTEARTLDKEINALDFGLQKKATKLIALRQPMGVDLRFVVSVLKIASSMERMGDLAKSTCRKAGKFTKLTSSEVNADLAQMNTLVTEMLIHALDAFRDMSTEKADGVLGEDDAVDDTYKQLLKDVQVLVKNNPEAIPAFADIIFAAKNFERIGDHVTKIADLVHYISTGQYVAKAKKAESLKNKKSES